jgi:nucleoside-diphosphate-sugar epimerase
MKRVLVTGGAGYVGSVLVPRLLEQGYHVTVVDKLMWGGHGLLSSFINPHFNFIYGDVSDETLMRKVVPNIDVVVHLAAMVGYPLCHQQPDLARRVNVDGAIMLSRNLSTNQLLIFASTDSVYGTQVDSICTEETLPNPVSIYGQTKAQAETIFLEKNSPVVLRFATAFGLSPRMRIDLLINDFVYHALHNKTFVVYESHYKRSFVHIRDIVASILFSIEHASDMCGRIFNVGSNNLNFTKSEIAVNLKQYINFHAEFAEIGEDSDQRNYFVSHERIGLLGFEPVITLDIGIKELIAGLSVLKIHNPYSNV